ncbi:DNA polymerase III subunit delta [Cytophagales bacterium LB-30]|uniref:DNA polymerase III subunit delta n=1 Tax=Shiella aurantiaca TaxID=3058365 RepID=A0ABT8F0V1_9BACT|nr:DNA polymerase III subunit delta [Shiella aurantiaca]MDN4164065.1 DNA polymerase III subunit delta [Shiella aurantiaca]
MVHKPEDILKDLKAGKYAPVYFLQGEEPFYIDQIADYIEAHAIDESQKGFNQVVLYGKDVDMGVVLSNARRFPMMSDRQVVIIKEAQEIKDISREAGAKLLEGYVQNPLPSTILVFCYKYKKLDGRTALTKQIEKNAVLVTSDKLYDNKLPAWIQAYVQSKGYSIQDKATQMFADNIGNNLERLSNEIDKVLINFKAGDTTIDPAMVQKYVGISKDFNVFELQKAFTFRNIAKVNQIIAYFEANTKAHPAIMVIPSIYQHFTRILMVHAAKDKSEAALSKTLGVHSFFVKEYLTAANNYPLGKAIQNIHHIRQADLQNKGIAGGAMSDGAILRELAFKLMH